MYDGLSLQQALIETRNDHREAVKQLMNDGIARAAAKRKYRVALAKKQLELREVDKLPATLIHDVSRGDPECADLKFDFDRCDVMYQVTLERIMLRKREEDIIREQIAREYSGGFNG